MEELWLVCEGEDDSVDVALLRPIFTRVLGAGIVPEHAGGGNPGAVAAFLRTHRGGFAAQLIDRDYRTRAQAEASFHDGTNKFIWRRHSIENYLLPPVVMVRAFQRLREQFARQFPRTLPRWVAAMPIDQEQVAAALRQCARTRAAEEACRMATYRLWDDLALTAGRIQCRVPSPPPADRAILGVWRDAIRQEMERLRTAANQLLDSSHLIADAAVQRFETLYAEVTQETYLANLEFLVDFHGRDLLRQFCGWLREVGVNLPYERLETELISAVVEVYAENRLLYGTDDFSDLANGVRHLAGLSPLG